MDNIKIFANATDYAAAGRPTESSRVALIENVNQVKYDGVNVEVTMPKPGDYVYRDEDGNVHFINKESIRQNLLPTGWVFIDVFYFGWKDEMFVDMGSGILWGKCDIDVTKSNKMCDTPFTYQKSFFSWGNIEGHNPVNNTFANVYNWGSVNAQEPWYEGQPYGETPGAALSGDIAPDSGYDAARENLGDTKRMPTNAEYGTLFNNIDYITEDGEIVTAATSIAKTAADKRVYVNGIAGLYLRSKINGKRLFFACSGYGAGTSWFYRGSLGLYWSSSFGSARLARGLYFDSGGVYPQLNNNRYNGFAVRPVQNIV